MTPLDLPIKIRKSIMKKAINSANKEQRTYYTGQCVACGKNKEASNSQWCENCQDLLHLEYEKGFEDGYETAKRLYKK